MDPIRIVAVDDHALFRDGLCRLLNAEPGLQVVGQTGLGRHVKSLVSELAPDLLLLDLILPDVSGLDVVRELDLTHSRLRTILVPGTADNQQVLEALRLGVRGLVFKESAAEILLRAIRAVMDGEYWFGQDQVSNLIDALRRLSAPQPRLPADTLTRREMRVIAAVVEGRTNRDISHELGMSEQTVKNHLSHIFDKLGVSSRLELALYAIEHKLRLRDRFSTE